MFQTKFYLIQFLTNIYIESKNVDNLYHLYLSIDMHQNTRLDLCHMRCQPLFHEKNWKGPLAQHEKIGKGH